MSIKLSGEVETNNGWQEIELENGDSLTVGIVPPSFGDRLADKTLKLNALAGTGKPGEEIRHRLNACLKDWKDVEGADGKPLKFSMRAFEALCSQRPDVLSAVIKIINGLFVRRLGNSQEGRSSKSTDLPSAETAPQSEAGSSQSGQSCDEQPDFEDPVVSASLT